MDAADRIIELVREAVPTLTVYDGKVPPVAARPGRFVVVYLAPGVRERGNVGGRADRQRLSWQTSSMATADDPAKVQDIAWQARWASRRIRDYLIERRVHPAGSLIEHEMNTAQGTDDQLVTTVAVGIVDQFSALA